MGIKKIEAAEAECDGCGKIQVDADESLITGFTGTVRETYAAGGSALVTFFACKSACISKAVVNALEEERSR